METAVSEQPFHWDQLENLLKKLFQKNFKRSKGNPNFRHVIFVSKSVRPAHIQEGVTLEREYQKAEIIGVDPGGRLPQRSTAEPQKAKTEGRSYKAPEQKGTLSSKKDKAGIWLLKWINERWTITEF